MEFLPRALQEILKFNGFTDDEPSQFLDRSGCDSVAQFRYFCSFFPPPPLTSQGKGCISSALRVCRCRGLDSEMLLWFHDFNAIPRARREFPLEQCPPSVLVSRSQGSVSSRTCSGSECDFDATSLDSWQRPQGLVCMHEAAAPAAMRRLCLACKLRVVEVLRPDSFVSLWKCISNPCALHAQPFHVSQRNPWVERQAPAAEGKREEHGNLSVVLSADEYARVYGLYVRLVLSVAETQMELRKGIIQLVDWLPSAFLGRAGRWLRSVEYMESKVGDDCNSGLSGDGVGVCSETTCDCWIEKACLFPAVFQIDGGVRISQSLPYRGQLIHSFDAASAAAAAALRVGPGLRVLDLCCAPGNKLMLLAAASKPPSTALFPWLSKVRQEAGHSEGEDLTGLQATNDGEECVGFVVGVDSSSSRMDICRRLLRRNGCTNALLVLQDGRDFGSASCCTCTKDDDAKEQCRKPLKVAEPVQGTDGRGTGRLALRKRRRREEAHAVPLLELSAQGVATAKTPSACVAPSEGYDRVLLDVQCTHDASTRHVEKLLQRMQTARSTGKRGLANATAMPSSKAKFHLGQGDRASSNDASMQSRDISLAEVYSLQRQLLLAAFALLRPGGILVYSSCSLDARQNEEAVEYLLERETSAFLFPIPCRMLDEKNSSAHLSGRGLKTPPPKGFTKSWCRQRRSQCKGFRDAYEFLEAHAVWPAKPSSLEFKQLRRSSECWRVGDEEMAGLPRPASCYFSGKEGTTSGQFLCCIQKTEGSLGITPLMCCSLPSLKEKPGAFPRKMAEKGNSSLRTELELGNPTM